VPHSDHDRNGVGFYKMTEEQFYNSLNLIEEGDYKKLEALRNRFESWSTAWRNLPEKQKQLFNPEEEWEKMAGLSIKLVLRESSAYPPLLKEISHPPFGVYFLGSLPQKEDVILAIVGTRKATSDGRELAKKFASELAQSGVIVISGLALGIDAAAHEGCVQGGRRTVAVLGSGLDYFYPRTNARLAEKILSQKGTIISEYPLGSPPLPYRFLERNRIISGLARGVLVIEAPERSGALVTAGFAVEQNREVFVVPGPATHPNFAGSHKLIRAGAELVTKPGEILETLGLASKTTESRIKAAETVEEKKILEVLKDFSVPVTIDRIIELTDLGASEANQVLTFLIIKNIVKETDGGYTIN